MSIDVEALLQAAREGDSAAVNQLVGYAQEALRAYASRTLKCRFPTLKGRHDTDSALNRLWLRVIEQFAQEATVAWGSAGTPLTTEGQFLAWMRRAIAHAFCDLCRSLARRPDAPLPAGDHAAWAEAPDCDPAQLAEQAELAEQFWAAVDELEGREKAVFDLTYFSAERPTLAAVGAKLGLSVATVCRDWASVCAKLRRFSLSLE